MTKDVSTVHVQAKLTPKEFEPFKRIIAMTGMKKATLFKKVILSNENNIVLASGEAKQDEEKRRLVFLANKASNNLNQIAKNLNQAYRGDIVSERHYLRIMNDLIGVRSAFEKGIDKC